MYTALLQIHKINVILFFLIYLVKTFLLLFNKKDALEKFTKVVKVPEMIISTLFLITGIWMFVLIKAIKTFQIIKLIAVLLAIPLAVIGFKKANKALAVISFILIVAAYGLAEMGKKQPYPVQDTEAEQPVSGFEEPGKHTYQRYCVMCHGEDGKKSLMGASDLSATQLDRTQLIQVVAEGRGNMAAYKTQLSQEEIEALAGYMEVLKNK